MPDAKRAESSLVVPALGSKVNEAWRRLHWPISGTFSLGWRSIDLLVAPAADPDVWKSVALLAARLLNTHLKTNAKWTCGSITAA